STLLVWLIGLVGLGLLVYFIVEPFLNEKEDPSKPPAGHKKGPGQPAVKTGGDGPAAKKQTVEPPPPPPKKGAEAPKLAPDALVEGRRFSGHTDEVLCVALSPDGRQALTGSKDRSVRLWDVQSGKELKRFDGHREAVWCVAFSPSGRRGLSGGD